MPYMHIIILQLIHFTNEHYIIILPHSCIIKQRDLKVIYYLLQSLSVILNWLFKNFHDCFKKHAIF